MAVSFPSDLRPIAISSAIEADWGVVSDYADDGTLHRRILFAQDFYRLNARWELMTPGERDRLVQFLRRNVAEELTLDASGYRYRIELIEGPVEDLQSSSRHGITAVFRGTRSPVVDPIAEILAAYSQASSWYDAGDLSTMWQDVDGTVPAVLGLPVARIDDKGNLGLHATQTTPANRPILQREGGRYYLQYDGAGDELIIPTGMPAPTTGGCAVVAFRHESYPGPYPIIYSQRGTPDDPVHRHPLIGLINTDNAVVQYGNVGPPSVPGSTPPGVAYVVTAYLDGDNISISGRLNGVLHGTATANPLTDAGDNPTGVVGFGDYHGRIYGIVHIRHGIADADRETLERELMRRAGML